MFSLQDTLAAVAGTLRQRAEKRARSFAELVEQVDSPKPPKPDVIADTLEAVGKTTQDLADAVELRQKRRTWKSQLERLPVAQAALRTACADQERVNADFQAAVAELKRKHFSAHVAINDRIAAAQAELNAAENARIRLIETGGRSDELQAAIRDTCVAAAELHNSPNTDWYRDRRNLQVAIAQTERELQAGHRDKSENELRRELVSYQSQLQAVEVSIAQHEAASVAARGKASKLEEEAVAA